MPAPSVTWDTKRVFITYRNILTLGMETGTWELVATGRITNTLVDGTHQVFRAGKVASGPLLTGEGSPSFDYLVPITDDPQNSPQGGEFVLTIKFDKGGSEVFHLSPLLSWPANTDLAVALDPEIVPSAPPFVIVGVPGGVARLDVDGDVVDADGVKVIAGGTGGGGGTGFTNYSQVAALPNYPATFTPTTGTTVGTAAAGNDNRLSDSRTPADLSVTNGKVAVNAAISLDKTADSATRKAMTDVQVTKLAGIQSAATANSTDATLLNLGNHNGVLPATAISDFATASLAARPSPDVVYTGTAWPATRPALAPGEVAYFRSYFFPAAPPPTIGQVQDKWDLAPSSPHRPA